MATLSELEVDWQLPKPNEVRKAVIPYGMLKGTYEISLAELKDTSGNVLTSYLIREKHDSTHRFALKDFRGSFYSDSDVRDSGIELAQLQHLMPLSQSPSIDQRLHDSLLGKLLYTDSAAVRQGEKFFIGRAYVEKSGELSLDLSRPHAEIAFSDGRVSELSKDALWKPLQGRRTMSPTKPTYLYNIIDNDAPNRFVGAYFWSDGIVYAYALRHPLVRVFHWGARSVKKIE